MPIMTHNIRDRNDFYEKFYLFFNQLSEYEKHDSNGIFSATITAIIQLLGHYINSRVSENDELKPLLFLIAQKLGVDSRNGVANHDIVTNISGYVYKVKNSRQAKDTVPMTIVHTTKPGVDFVFEQNPELADIGTKEQYSLYLETIFPESKIKDIVYHGSPKKFPKFKDPSGSGLSHIWFSEKPLTHYYGEYMYSVILNIKNPLNEFDNKDYNKEIRNYEIPINPEWVNNYHLTGELPQYKYDGTIRGSRVADGKSITARTPKQIHILGSEQDIDGFKRFVSQHKN